MTNQTKELDEIWLKLARTGSISGEELIQLFKNKGRDAESAYAFYEEWKGRGVLGIPLMMAAGQTVDGTKVPMMIRITDKKGREFLKLQGYTS